MDIQRYEAFLHRGWVPNWDAHPDAADVPVEMVLIEPRDHKYLGRVLENMSCLVPNAALTIVHSKENAATLRDLVGATSRVKLIPHFTENLTRDTYSELMTSPELWDMFSSKQVLLFQTDSGMRHNNLLRFMQYDYVGAPWNWPVTRDNDARICVGNGGFSLRTRALMKDICCKFKYDPVSDEAEDIFFARYLVDYNDAQLPTKAEAGMFSVEHLALHPDPMAFHKAYSFHPPEQVAEWLEKGLASTSPTRNLRIRDAWLESPAGHVFSSPDIVPWLSVGIGPDGLTLARDTRLSFLPDPFPGHRKQLHISFIKDGNPYLCMINLDRDRITEDVKL